MSTDGTCIEPNYVVPGANPCAGGGASPNPLNLPPTEAGNISTSALGITTWSLTFTPGVYTDSVTCSVVLASGGPTIAGFINGNVASFSGLTATTAYLATITCTNLYGSTPNTPPFPFTTGTAPGPPLNLAVGYCDITGKMQVAFDAGTNATSYTAVMTSISPNFNIVGIPAVTPFYFNFSGYPINTGVNNNVTIVVTARNAFGSTPSAPLSAVTFSPLGGRFTSQNIAMFPFGTGGYISPGIQITIPLDYSVSANTTRFSAPFTTTPIRLLVTASVFNANLSPANLIVNLYTALPGFPCGFVCTRPLLVGNTSFPSNTIVPWTSTLGSQSIVVGMSPGATLITIFTLPPNTTWSSFSRYNIDFTYNQGIGTLVP